VIAAVGFGREQGLEVAVRGGGHSAAGLGVVDGGLVIDLSPMRGVRIDPDARTAQVAGGSQLGDLDHAAHAFGLGTPSGIYSGTGVGGLTLGGGHGYLTRKYGLAIDNLLEVDMVLANGSLIRASETQNEDLFWAVRGGGGNFGVVTNFTFRLHPLHTVVLGITLWQLDQAADALRWYGEFMPQAPEDLYGFFAFLIVPPGPPFPEELHMKNMCGAVWCYVGNPDDQDAAFAGVRQLTPAFEFVTPMPYPALQSMFDPQFPTGMHCGPV
jgi:FAD/FMN-containing dehydrogenase